jgi:hypothetical protein
MRIVGWFEMPDNTPEPGSKEDDGDTWTVGFSYHFKYDKPVECVMFYPLMIHNQILGPDFRPTEEIDVEELHQRSYAMSAKNFSQFEAGRNLAPISVRDGLSIPSFDEFIPGAVIPSTKRIFTAMTSVDTTNPSLLMALDELGDWDWDADILAFLKVEAPFMTKRYHSIFCLSLYEGPALISDGILTVDNTLKVHVTKPLSLRLNYHVRLSLVSDLSLLTAAALERLRNHGLEFIKLLDALDPTLKDGDCWPTIMGANYISRRDLTCVTDCLNRATISKGDHQIRQFNTVMNLFVVANSRDR